MPAQGKLHGLSQSGLIKPSAWARVSLTPDAILPMICRGAEHRRRQAWPQSLREESERISCAAGAV